MNVPYKIPPTMRKSLFDVDHWTSEILKIRENYKYTIKVFTDQALMRSLIGLQRIEGLSIEYHRMDWEELLRLDPASFREDFLIDDFLKDESIEEIRNLAISLIKRFKKEGDPLGNMDLSLLIQDDGTYEKRKEICVLEAFKIIEEYKTKKK